MYLKINLKLHDVDLLKIKGDPVEKYGPPNSKIIFYNILDKLYFRQLHYGMVKFHIMPHAVHYIEIDGTGLLSPHIDPGRNITLNYYIDPADCETSFYELIKNVPPVIAQQEIKNQASISAEAYHLDDLKKTGGFKAQIGDAYLLNTKCIHSVTKPNNNVRKFISYYWINYSFEDILNSIELLNKY